MTIKIHFSETCRFCFEELNSVAVFGKIFLIRYLIKKSEGNMWYFVSELKNLNINVRELTVESTILY